MLASVGSELVGWGTLLLGIGSLGAVLVRKMDAQNTTQEQVMTAVAKQLQDHATSQRSQTIRYVDRRFRELSKNQETLLDMISEVDAKVTKGANIGKVPVVRFHSETESKVL